VLSDLSDRGIPKASRIVANVLTPSGDLSAGIKRRQLFLFVGIDVEIERSKTYHFSLVLLRDHGIAEATCIVLDVLDLGTILHTRVAERPRTKYGIASDHDEYDRAFQREDGDEI
jgi:hypothetical protein